LKLILIRVIFSDFKLNLKICIKGKTKIGFVEINPSEKNMNVHNTRMGLPVHLTTSTMEHPSPFITDACWKRIYIYTKLSCRTDGIQLGHKLLN